MNNEKKPEDKLREAAEAHTGYMFAGRLSPITPDSFKKAIEYFAKSKEAAEYHQSLQSVVDVDRYFMYMDGENAHGREIVEELDCENGQWVKWDDVKNRLQPPAPESSDAVDFADHILKMGFTRDPHKEGIWYSNEGWGIKKTSKQLYAEYKQSKINSDDKN